MAAPTPIPLTPIETILTSSELTAILTWPFAKQPFYEGNVTRLLQSDIPDRIQYGFLRIWTYQNPEGNTVGFATLDGCKEYQRLTGDKRHSYIPLLAVNPQFQKRGHGKSIVEHLIAEAKLELALQSPANFSDSLFLDVYTANQGAIRLYKKCGFVTMNEDAPIPDPQENNEPYIIMARNIVSTSDIYPG